jgi:type II secretory pathway component PulM
VPIDIATIKWRAQEAWREPKSRRIVIAAAVILVLVPVVVAMNLPSSAPRAEVTAADKEAQDDAKRLASMSLSELQAEDERRLKEANRLLDDGNADPGAVQRARDALSRSRVALQQRGGAGGAGGGGGGGGN